MQNKATKIKRNAPCPCGSGRKHKHCCGDAGAAAFTSTRILRCEDELRHNALEWSLSRKQGEQSILAAWIDFSLDLMPLPSQELEDLEPFGELFIPCWLYGGSAHAGASGSPVMEYLDACRSPADSLERRIACAIEQAPFSFHRVADVNPGRSVTLEDIFTRRRRVVQETALSEERLRSNYLFARVAEIDGAPGIYGNGPYALEPSAFRILKPLRDRLEEFAGGALTDDDLHESFIAFRMQYLAIVGRMLNPEPPPLVNFDGDTIVPTRLVYDLECDCEHALQKLETLAKGSEGPDPLDRAERDADGRVVSVSFPWIARRQPARATMGPLILGGISIETGRLVIDVNSTERADRIRSRVSRRLGTKARFRHAETRSLKELGPGPDPKSPEYEAAIEKRMKRHWKAWFDASIPDLEGLTPREAAKTEEGRELLTALLANYDHLNQRAPGCPTNANTAELRRELGLE